MSLYALALSAHVMGALLLFITLSFIARPRGAPPIPGTSNRPGNERSTA